MIVHPRRRSRTTVQPPMTALIDLVFLLLIYFLLTTNFMNNGGIAVKLPRARAASPRNGEAVVVTVDGRGRFYLDGKETDEAGLGPRLREVLAGSHGRSVVVRAERSVAVDRVVKVLDLARAAGAERLRIATERE